MKKVNLFASGESSLLSVPGELLNNSLLMFSVSTLTEGDVGSEVVAYPSVCFCVWRSDYSIMTDVTFAWKIHPLSAWENPRTWEHTEPCFSPVSQVTHLSLQPTCFGMLSRENAKKIKKKKRENARS